MFCLFSLSPAKKLTTSEEIYSSVVVLLDCPNTISAESVSVLVASYKISRLFLNVVSVNSFLIFPFLLPDLYDGYVERRTF